MKTMKTLNSFIGGLIIAFAIIMFIPSQATATTWKTSSSYNKGSSCEKNSKRSKGSKSS